MYDVITIACATSYDILVSIYDVTTIRCATSDDVSIYDVTTVACATSDDVTMYDITTISCATSHDIFIHHVTTIVYTYLLAIRTIAILLFPETPTISRREGDNTLAIVRIANT